MIPVAEPDLRGNELKYVTDCVTTEWVSSLGKYVGAFEERMAAVCNRQYAISVSNGTTALHLALVVLGIGPGDEVIVPSLTFVATANAVSYTGATPVFCDSEPDYWQMDPARLEGLITERTKAIIPVDLYGHPVDIDAIAAIAQAHHLHIIEDAAEAHGALYHGRPCGSLGDMSCFSFYGNKVITTGEGGMILTDNREWYERARMLRDHGSEVRYFHDVLGINSRLDELQAVVLRIKLRHLDEWNSARRRHALAYTSALKGTGLTTPVERRPGEHVYHLYVVRSTMRDRLREWLKEQGVATGIHYPVPIHLQVASKDFGCRKGDLPITETYAEEILSLPMYPELSLEQIEYVAECIRRFPGK